MVFIACFKDERTVLRLRTSNAIQAGLVLATLTGCTGMPGTKMPSVGDHQGQVLADRIHASARHEAAKILGAEPAENSIAAEVTKQPSTSGSAVMLTDQRVGEAKTQLLTPIPTDQPGPATSAMHVAPPKLAELDQAEPLTLSINGVAYRLTPVNEVQQASAEAVDGFNANALAWVPDESSVEPSADSIGIIEQDSGVLPENVIPMNLPSVLASINSQHPLVGRAQWEVRQAYAELDAANALWLPSIQLGFSWHRHDGNYQASNGDIVDVNRNSFQYGMGVGATGAGTTAARPGILAEFHLADAIFQPRVTERRVWAGGHAATATMNQQMRDASAAYFELLRGHQTMAIVRESRERIADLRKITVDFSEAGQGTQADADRLQTEVALMDGRLIQSQEDAQVAAVALARSISLPRDGTVIEPMDMTIVPLDLTTPESDRGVLVATALQNRPELKSEQALVAAACEAYRREKFAPFVPSVLLGFSSSGFGGGLGSDTDNIDGRYDFDAILSWQVRNLGYGERAARAQQSARVQQAKYSKLRQMDLVAEQVATAHTRVQHRFTRIAIAEQGIEHARESFQKNMERIRNGQGLPIEALQSAQALEMAQREYLAAVVDYNQAQIDLQWALGFSVEGL